MRKITNKQIIDEIDLRLKAPMVAAERIAEGKSLPKVFAEAALSELKTAKKLVDKLKAK